VIVAVAHRVTQRPQQRFSFLERPHPVMAAASIFGELAEIHARFKIQDLRWGRGAQRPGTEKSNIENLRFENRI
jgi:hypothetical protein